MKLKKSLAKKKTKTKTQETLKIYILQRRIDVWKLLLLEVFFYFISFSSDRLLFLTSCLTPLLHSCTDPLKPTSVKPNLLSSVPYIAFLLLCALLTE